MTWALLPVKDLVKAKSRLAGLLAPHERRALAQAMVEDVIMTLIAAQGLDGVLLVSDDPGAELLAHRYGVHLLKESALGCQGLNPVIAAAVGQLVDAGADSIMVVHGDIPLLTVKDVDALLARYRRPDVDVVLSPDAAGQGTNILVFSPQRFSGFAYGANSCQAHVQRAAELGLRLSIEARETVALDIDEPADLITLWERLAGYTTPRHTAAFVNEQAIQKRLSLVSANHMDSWVGTGP